MVVGFITIDVVSLNPAHGKVIKYVSEVRQVCGLLRFPPPIKLTATIKLKYF
jgi:hypothetical protein